jgi:hypothetical protein
MFGVISLGAAFVLLVYDGTRSIAADSFLYTNTAEAWSLLDAASLQRVQLHVQDNAGLWEPFAVMVFDAPAFLVVGSVGAISILLGTKKSRPTAVHPSGGKLRALSRMRLSAGPRQQALTVSPASVSVVPPSERQEAVAGAVAFSQGAVLAVPVSVRV